MRKLTWMLMVGALLACKGCLIGCGITDQVERERQSAVEIAKGIAIKVIDKARLDQTNMGGSAQVTNPEYQFTFVAGTGIYCQGVVRAIGVDVKAQLAASGQGMVSLEPDQDLRVRIDEILSRRDIAESQRQSLILQAVSEWLTRGAASAPGG